MKPLAQESDKHLVELAQAGNLDAFETLYHRHKERLYTVAVGILGNHSDAQDIVQEAYLRSFSRLEKLRKETSILAYLLRIVSNAAIDILRFRKTSHTVPLEGANQGIDEIPDAQRNPEVAMEEANRVSILQEALLTLPADQRVVVVMHHIEGLPVQDIAEQLKIPVGTVKSRLGRARETLRRKLQGKLEG
ncbi:MAG TPA: RNA polymerase sigma factor [Fimbriimonadales bacterium]|nr:RNA polymerase sigma factor [Fimbriimonadales bacterium]